MEKVVLVDTDDRAIGSMEKLEAHRRGALHRAFSIFLFDAGGRTLLQQRASTKYHATLPGGSNARCGHPRPGEELLAAASRRLREELGVDAILTPRFTFHYSATLAHGMNENEVDHVLFGVLSGSPTPDPTEVGDWRWVGLDESRSGVA